MCSTYLGIMPVKGESLIGSMIKLKWLRENMLELPEEPSQEQLDAHCRAYILGLIGGVLMECMSLRSPSFNQSCD
uniref:Serine/threonine protein phosphatase 7 long form isogeny n=1 Tax=Cajanus cajan TaxID=3821 RepID=A0A151TXC8_CAJCA|nr:hypothetical protein KK1_010996 [Cajanus cajan]